MTRIELLEHDIVGLRAANPGPLALSGTNTWIIARGPAYVIDPGPALPEHLDAVEAELTARGGLGAVALTHDHSDHSEALTELLRRFPGVPVAAGRGNASLPLRHGTQIGPLRAFATPGHASDHFAFIAGRVAFTGDAVLGEGSVFVAPEPGALAAYLDALRALAAEPLELICPGHGPVVREPAAKLAEYVEHRLDRERRLLESLARGRRTVTQLLDDVWDDVAPALRPAATVTLAAHLDKLADEGRLPEGVQRPAGVGRPEDWLALLDGDR
jgi:glyoxylase-like metal-dependent hydrolase (beta-lactamase superfamily II)